MNQSKNINVIIQKLFPLNLPTPNQLSKKYPSRLLKKEAIVTRTAPSPTGFIHIGGLYSALICERFAHQTKGIFYLRIEDTDKKREITGAANLITRALNHYGIIIDEGETSSGTEIGLYGPYKQSNRINIYKSYVKYLLEKNLAYPCFCTTEKLDEMRKTQEAIGVRTGYYKQWATCRNKSEDEILKNINEGKKFVIRFKSSGDFNKKITVYDILKGKRELSENDQDIVILKSDGLPTYHLAHVVDDHLMGTTLAIRGDEWFPSLPLHLQLFEALGWEAPQYGHISPIQKIEGSSKRKLSKRKDPEANVDYYRSQGYPEEAVIEYLLNLANSNFEDWRKSNKDKKNSDFQLTFEKLASSNGPLFDFNKLNNISKEIISHYSAELVYEKCLHWANKFNPELSNLLEQNQNYAKSIFNIERGEYEKVRKDIEKWADVKKEIEYFFDEKFTLTCDEAIKILADITKEDILSIVKSFIKDYDENDSKDKWFAKIKNIAQTNGYAGDTKDFKKNPTKFKGNTADVAKIFRVLLTKRTQTPDLYSIIQVMGKERVIKRLSILK